MHTKVSGLNSLRLVIVTFTGERAFAHVIKLRILRRHNLGLSRPALKATISGFYKTGIEENQTYKKVM